MQRFPLTFISSLLIGLAISAHGQSASIQIVAVEKPTNKKQLNIGDTISLDSLSFSSIRNYSGKKINLSDFKGKLIILDFWNRWCTSCIGYFPKMERIQQEFGDKVQVLLVTNDSYEEVKYLFDKSTIVKSTKLPFILGDTALNSLFPHLWVPYHVWIDEKGVVKATTNPNNTTIENIRKYFETGHTGFIMRTDYMDFDSEKSFLLEGNGRQLSQLDAYSVFLKRLKGSQTAAISILKDSTLKNSIGIKYTNPSMINLYTYAYYNENFSKLIIESSNPEKFNEPKNANEKEQWYQDNFVCYELRYPARISQMSDDNPQKLIYRTKKMRTDLDDYFPIISKIETRLTKCYMLSLSSTNKKLLTKGGEPFQDPLADGYFEFKNTRFSSIPGYIKVVAGIEDPIFDETGLSEVAIDMTIKLKWKDINSLKRELSRYGIDLKEETKLVKCLVLKEIE